MIEHSVFVFGWAVPLRAPRAPSVRLLARCVITHGAPSGRSAARSSPCLPALTWFAPVGSLLLFITAPLSGAQSELQPGYRAHTEPHRLPSLASASFCPSSVGRSVLSSSFLLLLLSLFLCFFWFFLYFSHWISLCLCCPAGLCRSFYPLLVAERNPSSSGFSCACFHFSFISFCDIFSLPSSFYLKK